MQRTIFLLSLLLCIIFSPVILSKEDPLIGEINRLVAKCKKTEASNSVKEVILGTTLLNDDEISDWKVCNTKSNEEYNDEAHLYFIEKRLSSAHIRLGTPTGDWGSHTYYCYREDESLAFIENNEWTFCAGSIKYDARIYFSRAGRKVAENVKYYDIETNKPIKEHKELYHSPEAYLTTKELLKKFGTDLKGIVPPWTTFN